jgi:hypothetical protein
MSFDIDIEGLCPECRKKHENIEFNAGRKIPVQVYELCDECKKKYGFIKPVVNQTPGDPEGENDMKKGKRKYTRRDDVAASAVTRTGKAPKLDRETKKFIKNIMKSGKKADKLQAKADKYQARADGLREQAASLRAGMDALKKAIEAC